MVLRILFFLSIVCLTACVPREPIVGYESRHYGELRVTHTFPPKGAEMLTKNAISFTLSHGASLKNSDFIIYEEYTGRVVAGTLRLERDGITYTFKPQNQFEPFTSYVCEVTQGRKKIAFWSFITDGRESQRVETYYLGTVLVRNIREKQIK